MAAQEAERFYEFEDVPFFQLYAVISLVTLAVFCGTRRLLRFDRLLATPAVSSFSPSSDLNDNSFRRLMYSFVLLLVISFARGLYFAMHVLA